MRKLTVLSTATLLLLVCFLAESARKNYGDVLVAEVVSVYDGDTFTANIEGYPPIIGDNIGIRVRGVDTPEMRDKRREVKSLALEAKRFTQGKLRAGKIIMLRNMERDKYFRIVADVYIDGESLGKSLVEAGFAKPYHGGKKPVW